LSPPYEGRSTGRADTGDKADRAKGVERMKTGQEAPEKPTQPESSAGSKGEGKMAPKGVGESVGRRVEDVSKDESEPRRQSSGPAR
jgi:hypothetical protein